MMNKILKWMLACMMIFSSLSLNVFAETVESELTINNMTTGTELHQFEFVGEWKTSTGYPDRFLNGDEHWFNFAKYYTPGSELPYYQVRFEGTGIELYGETQPKLGIYNVYIDNELHGQADAYSASRVSKTKLYGVEGLEYGEHILKVELSNTKNAASGGVDGEIDYVKVLGYQVEVEEEQTVTRIEDSVVTTTSEPFKFQYNGTWVYGNTHPELFSNADEHYTKSGSSAGAYYEMYFTGTRIQVYASVASGHGNYDVTLDGVTTSASGYSATKKHQQLIYDSGILENKDHHLKVALASSSSTKAMQVDFIEVTHGPLEVDSIQIDQEKITGTAGMTQQLNAAMSPWLAVESAKVNWTSSDDSVVTVDENGLVTIVSKEAATATITATIDGTQISDTVAIEVLPAVDTLKAFVGTTAVTASQENYITYLRDTNAATSFSEVAWRDDEILSSVVVATVDAVTNLKVEASDFISGENTFSKDNITINWLKETKANIGKANSSAPVKDFADIIHKGGAIDAVAADVLTAWINIKVPADCAPGVYTGTITVSANELETPYVFDYTFEVLDILQPSFKEIGTEMQLWQHPFSVAEYYGVAQADYFTEEHFKYLRASMEEYASIGGNDAVTNIVEEAWNHQCYYGDPSMVKWTKNADGTWSFDYTWYDAWVEFLIECGVIDPETGYGRIKCYSIVPWNNKVKYYDAATQSYVANSYTPGSDAWKAIWTPFLESFVDHSMEKGWFDITYISMDERSMSQIEPSIELIHQITNEDGEALKISSAFNTALTADYSITDQIDDISVGQKHVSHTSTVFRDLANHRRELGLTTTIYTCTGDYPSNYTISDPIDNTWVMWNTMYQEADGYLRWAWDSWVADPLTNVTYKSWEPGDGWFIYPVEKNTESDTYFYSTPRYEMFKQGIRDVNKAKYLKSLSDDLESRIDELVGSLQRPNKGSNEGGSASYKTEADRQLTISEATRMRTTMMAIAKDYAENGTNTVTKKALREALENAETAYNNPFGYTDESYASLKQIYELAVAVNEADDASQEEVDAVVATLNSAIENLVAIVVPELDTNNLINTSATTDIKVIAKSSECVKGGNPNEDGEASNLLDYDSATYWHSDYKNAVYMPQYITFDLGAVYSLSDVTFLPRQGAKAPGAGDPLEVKLYGGTDANNLTLIGVYVFDKAGDVLANRSDFIRMYVTNEPEVQFVKFEVLQTGAGGANSYANAAEIRFYGSEPATFGKVKNVVANVDDYKTVTLTWDAVKDADKYMVERYTSDNEWVILEAVEATTYTVTGLKTGKEYTYRVRAIQVTDDQLIEAEASDEVKVTPMLSGEIELTLAMNGTNKFDLAWNEVAGATRYIIYRKANEGEWKKILTLGKDARSYTSNAMVDGTYTYVVKAARYDSTERVMGPTSNEVVGVSVTAEVSLSISKIDDTSMSLSWDKVEGMKYYEVYRATEVDGVEGTYRLLKRTTDCEVVCTGLNPEKVYYFKLRAYTIVNGEKVYTDFSESVLSKTFYIPI